MAAISQTTYSDAFSWKKIYEFRLRFPMGLININSTLVLDNGLVPNRRRANICTNDGKFTNAYMRHSPSIS